MLSTMHKITHNNITRAFLRICLTATKLCFITQPFYQFFSESNHANQKLLLSLLSNILCKLFIIKGNKVKFKCFEAFDNELESLKSDTMTSRTLLILFHFVIFHETVLKQRMSNWKFLTCCLEFWTKKTRQTEVRSSLLSQNVNKLSRFFHNPYSKFV